jgi:hypothetical protein
MRIALALILVVLAGCGATPTPTTALPTRLLPPGTSGIPSNGDPTATLQPQSPAATVPVGVPQTLPLGHCGLGSPIDFNAALWDPSAGDDGAGGSLTDEQLGELVNATLVELTLVDDDTALLMTPAGGRIALERHDGSRAYYLCD